MQQMAIGWLIYRITNSAFMLGLVGFLSQIPTLILTPLAGVLADRIGAANTLVLGGSCCIAASAAFAAKLPSLNSLIKNVT